MSALAFQFEQGSVQDKSMYSKGSGINYSRRKTLCIRSHRIAGRVVEHRRKSGYRLNFSRLQDFGRVILMLKKRSPSGRDTWAMMEGKFFEQIMNGMEEPGKLASSDTGRRFIFTI